MLKIETITNKIFWSLQVHLLTKMSDMKNGQVNRSSLSPRTNSLADDINNHLILNLNLTVTFITWKWSHDDFETSCHIAHFCKQMYIKTFSSALQVLTYSSTHVRICTEEATHLQVLKLKMSFGRFFWARASVALLISEEFLFKKSDTFQFKKHVSTETSVIFSYRVQSDGSWIYNK